jgi:uncharacterized protein
MSRLLLFDRHSLAEPEISRPQPQRLIRGDPVHSTWNLNTSEDEKTFSGFWQSTPGAWRVIYDEWEFCTLIEGVSILHEDGQSSVQLEAGQSFVLRPGFSGVWDVVETTLKTYVIRLT